MMDVAYRASELGGCTRFLIGKRMGYTEMPPPTKFQEYFARGDRTETKTRERLIERGWTVETGDHEDRPGSGMGIPVVLPITDSIGVTGHLDGIIYEAHDPQYAPRKRVWECKRVSPKIYDQFVEHGWEAQYDLLDKYKWQVSVYMLATGLELWFTVTDDERTLHLYQEEPFYSELQIRTRVLMIEAAAQHDGLPETCDRLSYPCPLYYLPGHDQTDEEETDEVVNALALAVVQATQDTAAAKLRESDLRKQLLAAMGDRKKVRADSATVSVLRSTRTETDYEQMRADGFDLSKYQRKVEGDEYVRVTPRKANRDSEDNERAGD